MSAESGYLLEGYWRTCCSIRLSLGLGCPACNVLDVHRHPRFGQVPKEVLNLIPSILVVQELDELVQPSFGELYEQAAGIAQVGVVGVEYVRGQEAPQIDDDLLIGWHVPISQSPNHLVGVEFLVNLALQDRVIAILGKQRALVVSTRLAESEARRHVYTPLGL